MKATSTRRVVSVAVRSSSSFPVHCAPERGQTGGESCQAPLARRFAGLCALATALLLLVSAPAAQGESAGSGTVEGRVLNVATGTYLNNARVTVEGTDREVFTNAYGEYRIAGLPAGEVRLTVLYTGLEQKTAAVVVQPGQTAQEDFRLTSGQAAREGAEGEVIELDAYQVSSERVTEANAIAVNEQRFAPNIKNVVSSDAFGDVTEGNVGEFLKFLPGISVEYTAADIRSISVRGLDSRYTGVTIDGARQASANFGGSTRSIDLYTLSINNVSRIEVTKVPTPEMPSDTLGGSVNMVSRNAFERAKSEFRYRAYFSVNSEDTDISKTPGPHRKETYKILPGFDFNYIAPLSRSFGLVVNGISSNQFNEQHRSQPTWRFTGAGATPANPYLRNYTFQDGPKNSFRDSINLKADWKVAGNHVLSGSYQYNYYGAKFGNRNMNWDVGGATLPAASFGPTFTHGAAGAGAVVHGASFRDLTATTHAALLNYRLDERYWKIEAGLNTSIAKNTFRDLKHGHFESYTVALRNVTVNYDDITYPRPQQISVYSPAGGGEIDAFNLSNYRLEGVRSRPVDAKTDVVGAFAKVKRDLDFLPFPASLKTGFEIRREKRDLVSFDTTWDFLGADGVANTADDTAAALVDRGYSGEDPYWGLPRGQWPDPFAMYDLFRTNPGYFSLSTTRQVNAETFRINNSSEITETISAGFLQFEAGLLSNRLRIVTGTRLERTKDEGAGPLSDPDAIYQRDSSGQFVRDANGNRVLITTDPLAQLALRLKERAFRAERTYDGYYPSFHATYHFRDNLLARFAYAKTLGRPDYSNIIPNTTIDESDSVTPDPNAPPGTILVRNTGLKPWEGKNYDLSVEFYFQDAGVVSVGVFRKDITDFFGNSVVLATPELLRDLGLDQRYVGWQVTTQINSGDARIDGIEFNYNQGLSFLPGWGKNFSVFANGTKMHLEGASTADFNRFIPETANWGFTFNRHPVTLRLNWNYRGQQRLGANASAPNAFDYYASRVYLDVNVEYEFSERFALFLNGRNILNKPQVNERISPDTPEYSRHFRSEEYGVQWALGVKGTF